MKELSFLEIFTRYWASREAIPNIFFIFAAD
jgi:hypothetical protein